MVTLEVTQLRGHRGPVGGICVDGAGQTALSSSEDGTLRIWDLRTHRSVRAITVPSSDVALGVCAFRDRGKPLDVVIAAADKTLLAFDLRGSDRVIYSGSPAARGVASDDVGDFDVSEDGSMVACPTDAGTVELLSSDDLTLLKTLSGGHDNVASVARFRKGRSELVSGGFDEHVAQWDPKTSKLRHRLPVREWLEKAEVGTDGVTQICNPPFVLALAVGAGEQLAAGLGDGTLLVFPRGKLGAPSWMACGHRHACDAVVWLGKTEEQVLASAGRDLTLRLWDARAAPPPRLAKRKAAQAPGPQSPVPTASLSLGEKVNGLVASGHILLLAEVGGHVSLVTCR